MWLWHSKTPPTTNHAKNKGGEIIPDRIATEPIVGYRSWQVVNTHDGLALMSLHKGWLWSNPAVAECVRPSFMGARPETHVSDAPDPDCACGLYAQLPEHPLSEWESSTIGHVYATGTVSLYGRVVKCERGYKAQYARLQSPIVLDAECASTCAQTPTRVHLDGLNRILPVTCTPHFADGPNKPTETTVELASWMRYAVRELGERYDTEFITWHDL